MTGYTANTAAGAALCPQRLETMKLIRAYEEKLAELQRQGAPGSCTSVGQEACAVGVIAALEADDKILTNHRSAAHLLARGADPARMIAEVLGREGGYCRGRSGNLHMSVKELGVILTSTIVGGELSLAPGVALAQKMGTGEDGALTAVFFGDGAACEGIFHEALNLSVQWQLPVLFVCENNQWQAFVHRLETMSDRAIADWARGHQLPVQVVDGNDVDAVFTAASQAVSDIRAHGGPAFLELLTYRQRGHFEPDDQAYVDPIELDHWRSKDPILRYQSALIKAGALGPGALQAMENRVADCISWAVKVAQASAWPDPSQLNEHVYA